MKKSVLAATTFLAFAGFTGAFAADLPTRAYTSPPVVAQVYNWTGLYVGVNGGYGWGTQDPLTLISNRFDRSSFNINGGMVGGTVGAQIQQGYVCSVLRAILIGRISRAAASQPRQLRGRRRPLP